MAIAQERPLPEDEDVNENDEPIPATLRSSVLLLAHEPVSRPIIVDLADPPKDLAASLKEESHKAA